LVTDLKYKAARPTGLLKVPDIDSAHGGGSAGRGAGYSRRAYVARTPIGKFRYSVLIRAHDLPHQISWRTQIGTS